MRIQKMPLRENARPVVIVSKCLGFAACRWDGAILSDASVKALKPRVKFMVVCPEVGSGLGVPRDPIRIVMRRGARRLIQLNTEKDVTGAINKFTAKFLDRLERVDGFILKDRSPCCGIRNVKVYAGLKSKAPLKRSSGLFGSAVLARFPRAAVETEARLASRPLRKKFLARIFAAARSGKTKGP